MSDELIDLSALEEQMSALNKEIAALKKSHIESSKKVFHNAVAAFFKAFPEIEAMMWHQYTPYFNDGDSCEFSVHDLYFVTKEDKQNLDDGEIRLDDLYDSNPYAAPDDYVFKYAKQDGPNKQYYVDKVKEWEDLVEKLGPRCRELGEGLKKFKKIFHSIPDDTMLSLFGDHVTVTATRKEITVDEYDHE